MAIQVSGNVVKGNLPGYAAGSSPISSFDQYGGNLVSELNARYSNLALSGLVFSAATTTGVALAALGTNSPIFTLWNPTNSGKNLVLIDISWGLTTQVYAAAAATVTLGALANVTAAPSTTTPIVGVNNFIGNGTKPVAFTYSQATLSAAPTASRHLGTVALDLNTTVSAVASPAYLKDEVAGAIIIGPGSLVSIGGEGTPADITIVAAMTWAELPL
jgi:hypothetical protein